MFSGPHEAAAVAGSALMFLAAAIVHRVSSHSRHNWKPRLWLPHLSPQRMLIGAVSGECFLNGFAKFGLEISTIQPPRKFRHFSITSKVPLELGEGKNLWSGASKTSVGVHFVPEVVKNVTDMTDYRSSYCHKPHLKFLYRLWALMWYHVSHTVHVFAVLLPISKFSSWIIRQTFIFFHSVSKIRSIEASEYIILWIDIFPFFKNIFLCS